MFTELLVGPTNKVEPESEKVGTTSAVLLLAPKVSNPLVVLYVGIGTLTLKLLVP
jgi:hypothetical protein